MKLVPVNNIVISYDEFGDSKADPILLISGLGTQKIRWTTSFCEHLAAQGFRVIRFDNRDAGESTHLNDSGVPDFAALARTFALGQKPNVPYTLYDMLEDAIGLLDALKIKQAHLVGRSMGGMIAQLMASKYPERVLSLVSIMSSTGNPSLPATAPDIMAMLTKPAPNPFENETEFLEHSLAFAKRIASPRFQFDEAAHRMLILEELKRAYNPSGFGRQIAAIAATGDIRPQLARIVAPTLVIHGSDDAMIPPACGEDTATSIPGAKLMLIDGMGHELPSALYETVIDAIVKNMHR